MYYTSIIKEYVEADGRLRSLSPWVSWYPGQKRISLDGEFTVEELEVFVHYMKIARDTEYAY